MTPSRVSRFVAAFAAASSVALSLIGAFLIVMNWPLPLTIAEWGFPGFQGLAAVVFALVGLAVAVRRPTNPIGWLLLVAGVASAVQFVGHQYALYGIVSAPGAVPQPSIGTWIEEWIWIPILASMGIFTFLLFPTGRLPSPRWRIVAWAALPAIVFGAIGTSLLPTERVPGAINPLTSNDTPPIANLLVGIGLGLLVPALVAACASLVIRFRRATGVERQQLKWLALGGLVVGFVLVVYMGSLAFGAERESPLAAGLAVSVLGIPVAIALAMLRYGLYEIDRLINRTVVYGLVSVVLLGLYAGSVLVLQAALTWLTNGQNLAVAASTLMVAAIFQPVRRRVQQAVDRRFNRARYDARRTVEEFGTRLRDEVDLQQLRAELGAVVAHTVQPASVTIWLRRTD
jgi:hypothetical protein